MSQSNSTAVAGACSVATLNPTPGCISVTASGDSESPRRVMKTFVVEATFVLGTKSEVVPLASVPLPVIWLVPDGRVTSPPGSTAMTDA